VTVRWRALFTTNTEAAGNKLPRNVKISRIIVIKPEMSTLIDEGISDGACKESWTAETFICCL